MAPKQHHAKRTLDKTAVPRLGSSNGPKESIPEFIAPALATRVANAPGGDDWIHEIKLDGYRLLARKANSTTRLITRNKLDWTSKAKTIADELTKLDAKTAILDGELVMLDANGISHFQSLQNLQEKGLGQGLLYMAFDILHLDGRNLRGLPLLERKAILEKLLKTSRLKRIKYCPHFIGGGPDLAESACQQGLEGIICKRANDKYSSGRSKSWLKVKCDNEQEFVICGFAPHSTKKSQIGALMLCVSKGRGKFAYAGKVGTGFNERSRKDLFRLLSAEKIVAKDETSPVTGIPRSRESVLVKPIHVAQIHFRELTSDGLVRQGVFHGLREDKEAADVAIERAEK